MGGENVILVRAVHRYTPLNNDELKLEKGDIITLTQKLEGGWWEGTLDGRTGWFPSNYVEEVQNVSTVPGSAEASPIKRPLDPAQVAQQAEYRRIVITDLIESETAHIGEIQGMWDTYLVPLSNVEWLTTVEYKVLVGNLADIIHCHTTNLQNLIQSEQGNDQRIGMLFLENAPRMESLLKAYCSNHPKAVQVVEKYKEELSAFMESKGAKVPGVLVLIVGLSQPFRRLEKYPTMLQEVERHVEESHKDRGDLQRSIEYYKDIDITCTALRKQKEMELEVLSGAIVGWEGSDVYQLGEILLMNLVHVGYDRQPRYFVLFPGTLLILSYENNDLVYEGKIPITGITLTSLPDKDTCVNAFEIAGPMIDQIIVSCATKQSKDAWLQHINKILKTNRFPSFGSSHQSFGHLTSPIQAWNVARLRPSPPFNPFLSEYLNSLAKSSNANGTQSHHLSGIINPSSKALKTASSPCPQPAFTPTPIVTNEDDIAILSIVDAFCAKNRQQSVVSGSNLLTSSAASIHSQTSIVNNHVPKIPIPRNKTLAELVFHLTEDMTSLKTTMSNVSQQLEEEQRQRKTFQEFIQTQLMKTNQLNN